MQQFQQSDNKPKLSHELIAGAAAYYAADKYEEHCEANGKEYFPPTSPYPDLHPGYSMLGVQRTRRA